MFKVLPTSCQIAPLYLNTKMSVFASVSVVVGAVSAAKLKTAFHATVWLPLKLISIQIKAPSTALLGAEIVVFSVVKWYAFAAALASQATAFDDEVSATCATLAATEKVATPAWVSVPLTSKFPLTSIKVELSSSQVSARLN